MSKLGVASKAARAAAVLLLGLVLLLYVVKSVAKFRLGLTGFSEVEEPGEDGFAFPAVEFCTLTSHDNDTDDLRRLAPRPRILQWVVDAQDERR